MNVKLVIGGAGLIVLVICGGLSLLWMSSERAYRDAIAASEWRPPLGEAHTVVAVGDLCGRHCDRVAALVAAIGPALFLPLGDLAYESGTRREFETLYEPHFGRFKNITRPAPGNHEHRTADAAGYFDYFNGPGQRFGPAGDRRLGYYSFDLGSWHLVSLNSQLRGEAHQDQLGWLSADLESNAQPCTLAYWHIPRYTAGRYDDAPAVGELFRVLVSHRADLILAGHDHNYQHFEKLNADNEPDAERGVRSFVVGTGGRAHDRLTADPRHEAADDETFGVLKLDLHPGGYRWEFVAEKGSGFEDAGEDVCQRSRSSQEL